MVHYNFKLRIYIRQYLFRSKNSHQTSISKRAKRRLYFNYRALRASRLKINKRKYFPIKIQMPIHYTKNDDEDFRLLGIPLKIRGENEKEFQFIKYMGKDIFIYDVNTGESTSNQGKESSFIKKIFP